MTAAAIQYRNDELDGSRKSYWIYKAVEHALAKVAREGGRDLKRGFALDGYCRPRRGTTYSCSERVVSIGLAAHETLAPLLRSSLIYLDPDTGTNDRPCQLDALTRSAEAARRTTKMVFLGRRAKTASAYLPFAAARHYELPPVDLSGLPVGQPDAPRLMIVNHLADEAIAQSIARRFLEGSDFALECIGLTGEAHNRVRYLDDAEVSDAGACVHVHVGVHDGDGDRLRISDSWQSSVPVLFFDVDKSARVDGNRRIEVRNEHDVLVCRTYEEACGFLSLILETPSLRRLMTVNGRGSAAPMSRSWIEIAQDLAA